MKVVVCGEERTNLSWREQLGQFVIKLGSWLMSKQWPHKLNIQTWTRSGWAEQMEAYRREREFAADFLRKWEEAGSVTPSMVDTLDLPPMTGHQPPKEAN